MFITLQDTDGSYESTLGTMSEVLPKAMFDFLAPRGTEWDTPVVGERVPHGRRFRVPTCTICAPRRHATTDARPPTPTANVRNSQRRASRRDSPLGALGFGSLADWELGS